jgi:hypothetical protein
VLALGRFRVLALGRFRVLALGRFLWKPPAP